LESYLILNANILTFGEKPQFIPKGALYIGRGTILDFGTEREILNRHSSVQERVDAGGKVVMPGYIDMHNHLYSGFFNNIPLNLGKISSYPEFMDKYWWKLTGKLSSDGIYYSAVKGIINAIKSGVTTIFNLHSSPNCINDSLEDIAEAFDELSMRGVLAYEINDRKGEAEAEKMLEINQEFISNFSSNSLVTGMIGLYSANQASDSLLSKISKFMRKTGSGLMIHLSEFEEDDEISLKKYKKYSIDRLQEHGLLTPKTMLVSSNYVDEYEVDVIAKTESNVIITPSSSFYKGFDFAPLDLMLKRKVSTSIGSDGIYPSIAKEADFAYKILRQQMKNFESGNQEISDMMTKHTAKIANKFVSRPVGEIKLGAAADLIFVDYIPEYEINEKNLQTHFMFGILPSRTSSTIVNGNFVMKDYKIIGIDENELNGKYIEFASELM